MAKQLNVNLAFTADTSAAKQQLQQLQQQLNNLTTNSITSTDFPLTAKLHEAQNAVASLQVALNSAMNVNTGKLDLSKFNQSLKSSGLTVEKLRLQLQQFGPEGSQAFMSLAQSVMSAEVPMRRTNALLLQLGTTLKNTAKWQISSSILHGFMSSVQTAYRYSQDLNKSLNNIRIVTGHNIEYMEKFAASANKAAKSLSASTLDYTNASLIYYQQGLNDEEVKQRTEATVKMANVLGESAKDVSSYMTAIWNNFDDGTKSLEYYGDAMAALGAATASSSAEIAQGLEKFVSIGKTVGLTYEYATAALATVVAKTRQSADTVGTAFKTIFSRLQGLQLGETLEDGTDLNKYSEALQVVGVDIKTSNGELKQMDTILDELGSKWQTLAQDEKMALAQTVAGVRQYTQLISLMDNYNDFKDNVSVALNSSGTLDKQNEIYAEGWEATSKRVKAAVESIYSSILDDKFFISVLNGFENFITLLDKAIKSMGGLKGVLAGLSTLLLKTFSVQAAKGLENMAYNMKMMTAYGRQQVKDQKNAFYNQAMKVSSGGYVSESQEATTKVFKDQLTLQHKLEENADKLSDEELKKYQYILDQNKAYGDQYVALTKNKEALQDRSNALNRQAYSERQDGKSVADVRSAIGNANQNIKGAVAIQQIVSAEDIEKVKQLGQSLQGIQFNSKTSQEVQKLCQELNDGTIDATTFNEKIKQLKISEDSLNEELAETQRNLASEAGISESTASKIVSARYQVEKATVQAQQAEENYKRKIEETSKSVEQLRAAAKNWASQMVSIAQGISSVAFGLSAISGIVNTLKDPETSGWEKFLSIAMSLSMIIPALTSMVKLLNIETWKSVAATTASIGQNIIDSIVTWANTKATEKNTRAKGLNSIAKDKSTKDSLEEAAADTVDTVATEANTQAELRNQSVKGGKPTADQMKRAGYTRHKGHYFRTDSAGNKTGNAVKRSTALKDIGAANKGAGAVGTGTGTAGAVGTGAGTAGGGAGATGLTAGGGAVIAGAAVAITAIVAGIAIIAAGSVAIYNWWNKASIEAEKAAKEAEKMKEAYQGVKAEYDSLTNTISDYQSAKDGLEELTKGTVEFKQAIFEANEKALELINNYEGLRYTVNSDGLIEIDKESLQNLQSKELEKVSNAQNAQMIAQQIASKKKIESDTVDIQRDNLEAKEGWTDEQWNLFWGALGTGTAGGAAIGAGVGTGVGSWTLGLATAAGAGIGAGVGALAGGVSGAVAANELGGADEREAQAIDAIYEAFKEEGNAIFNDNDLKRILRENNITDTKLIDSVQKEKEAIKKLILSMDENSKQTKALNSTMINNQYQEIYDKYGLTEASGQLIGNMFADDLDADIQKLYEDKWKDMSGGMTDEEIQKKYAEAMGYKYEEGGFLGWGGTNRNGNKGVYKDKEGNPVEVSDEVARTYLAKQEAGNNLKDRVEEMAKVLSEVEDDFVEAYDNMSSYGDYEKLKQDIQKKLTAQDVAQDQIDSFIDTFLEDTTYGQAEAKIEGHDDKENIEKWIKTLEKDELEVFLTMDINKDSSLENIKEDLDWTQDQLDKETLSIKINAAYDAKNLIDSGQYGKDLKEQFAQLKFDSSYEDILKDDALSKQFTEEWAKFLKLSKSEQKKMFDEYTLDNNNLWAINNEKEYLDSEKKHKETVDKENRDKKAKYNEELNYVLSTKNYQERLHDLAGREAVILGLEEQMKKYTDDEYIQIDDETNGGTKRIKNMYWTGSEEYKQLKTDYDEKYESWRRDHAFSTDIAYPQIQRYRENYLAGTQPSLDDPNYEPVYEVPVYEPTEYDTEKYNDYELAKNIELDNDNYIASIQGVIEEQGLEIENVNQLADAFSNYGSTLGEVSDDLRNNEKASMRASLSFNTQKKNILDLQNNWKDFSKILSDPSLSGVDKQKVFDEINEGLYSILGTSENVKLSQSFILQNFDLIQKALQGDQQALEELKQKSEEEIIISITGNKFEELDEETKAALTNIKQYAQLNGLKYGDILSDEQLKFMEEQFNYLSTTAGWSAEKIKAYFKNAGYEIDILNGKLIGANYFDASKLLINDKEIKENAKALAKQRAEEAKDAKDREKQLNNEIDRYHTIEELLDDISKEMNEIAKQKDRAYGKNKLKYIEQEIAGYEAQVAAQDALIKSTEQWLELDKKNAESVGLQINPNTGNIINYEAKQAEYLQKLAGMDPESAEYIALEQQYENFKDYAAKYEETYDKYQDAITAKTEAEMAILDAKLEGISYSVQIKLEVNETKLKLLEFLLEQLNDAATDGVEQIKLITEQISLEQSNIEANIDGIKKVLETAGITYDQYMAGEYNDDTFSDEQITQLTNYTDAVLNSQKAILQYKQTLEATVTDTFDAWMEKFDKNAAKVDAYNSIVDSYKNIVDVVGKDTLGISDQMMDDLTAATKKAADTKIANAKAQKDFADNALAEAQAQRDAMQKLYNEAAEGSDEKAAYEKDLEYWNTQVDDLTQKALDAQANFTSELSNGLQLAADQFAEAIEKAFEKFNDILAGDAFKTFDQLQDAFDKQQKTADRFLDNGAKLYNISKLNRQIQKDLDETDNVKAKQTLQELQSEILAYQEDGVEMSERDLEAFQKKYDLKLAEIALEEAQNAKSQVRMTRDSEGNWGYTYTADENNIAEAEQNYEDKLEENRKWLLEQNNDLTQAIIDNRKAMSEALAAINRADYESDAAYQQALNETSKWYVDQEAYLLGEMDKIVDASIDMYENDYTEYNRWSGMKGQSATTLMNQLGTTADPTSIYGQMGANANGWLSSFGTVIQQMGYKYQEVANSDGTGYANQLAIALGTAGTDGEGGSGLFGDISKATYNLSQSIDQSMGAAGTSVGEFKNTVANNLYGEGGSADNPKAGSILAGMDDAIAAANTYKNDGTTAFKNVADGVIEWQKVYSPKVKDGSDKTVALNEALYTLKTKYSTVSTNVNITFSGKDAFYTLKTDLEKLNNSTTAHKVVVTTENRTTMGEDVKSSINFSDPNSQSGSSNTLGQRYSYISSGQHAGKIVRNDSKGKTESGETIYFDRLFTSAGSVKEGGTVSGGEYFRGRHVYDGGGVGPTEKTTIKQYNGLSDFDIWSTSDLTYGGRESVIDPATGELYIRTLNASAGSGIWYKFSDVLTVAAGELDYLIANKTFDQGLKDSKFNKGAYFFGPNTPQYKLVGYDTGGYTGDWGDEGRLAMLHQKEIVLNASDTENFLRAVEIVREIAGIIDLNAQAASFGLGNINASAVQNHNQTIEQEVTIHAEFPNATNHSEIEEAFNNLINTASQYANRKNR